MEERPALESEEEPPAYEDMAHMVRRIVREELQPVVDSLAQLQDALSRGGAK